MDICTTKSEVASQKQLELACPNHGIVGPLTFEIWSVKLEMNYSVHQKRDDWRLKIIIITIRLYRVTTKP